MKLRKGLTVTIGRKSWIDEIPEAVFKDWPKGKADAFRKLHGAGVIVPEKQPKADK